MVQKSDTSASCDESGMGKLAVKLRGWGDTQRRSSRPDSLIL
jgi:hypothetical protein